MKLSDEALAELCSRSLWAAEHGYELALADDYVALLSEEVGSDDVPGGVQPGSAAHVAALAADAHALRKSGGGKKKSKARKQEEEAPPAAKQPELPVVKVEPVVEDKAPEADKTPEEPKADKAEEEDEPKAEKPAAGKGGKGKAKA